MWNKLKAAAETPIWRGIKKFCGDPVQLYAVFLVMTAMYYYHQAWTWLYTLLAVVLSFVLMRFYDFVAKHRFIGPVCYLVFLFGGLYGVTMLYSYGEQIYPISFLVWFLTPQGVVDFMPIYTISMYILMVGFLTSTVYYFGKVRYRMSMQFLIMLIPLSLYAKEGRQMPALLVILLLASFFLLMIYCRQLRDTAEVRQIPSFHSGASIAAYVAAFSIIAAIIPKPAFEADREFIDNAMSYTNWSESLMRAISMFTDTTSNRSLTNNSARTIAYAEAPEALRLRDQTYTFYQEDDSWSVTDIDRLTEIYQAPMTYKPQELLQAICDAAGADPAFAARYGLTEAAGQTLPEQAESKLHLFNVLANVGSQFGVFSPTRTDTLRIVEGQPGIIASETNSLSMDYQAVELVYYSDTYARYEAVHAVLSQISRDEYQSLLTEAAQILEASAPGQAALLREVQTEAQVAENYLAMTDAMDWRPETVQQLAAEITKDQTSDLDKALAIERYFTEQGYVYDAAYAKADGENVEDFLSTVHKGVCWEYATAMTLLCRSAGLPARLTTGFNMGEQYRNTVRFTSGEVWNFNYVIKARDAHAFPEVYISGYGWVSFEPTVAAEEVATQAENINVMNWGYVLLALFLLVLAVYLMLPVIRERLFRRRIHRMTAQDSASAVFRRMRRTMRLSDSTTVRELAEASAPFGGETELFDALDVLLYSHETTDKKPEAIAAAYIRWQNARRDYDKEQRKLRRQRRKSKAQ